jgi:hypothetical protein
MARSPLIRHGAWGVTQVAGLGRFKDARLWPGGGGEWDWRETGTHHDPGIQIADVEPLVDLGAEAVVLTRGRMGRLCVPRETFAWLEERGIEAHVARTPAAIEIYNRLVEEGRPVGGLFHSTC